MADTSSWRENRGRGGFRGGFKPRGGFGRTVYHEERVDVPTGPSREVSFSELINMVAKLMKGDVQKYTLTNGEVEYLTPSAFLLREFNNCIEISRSDVENYVKQLRERFERGDTHKKTDEHGRYKAGDPIRQEDVDGVESELNAIYEFYTGKKHIMINTPDDVCVEQLFGVLLQSIYHVRASIHMGRINDPKITGCQITPGKYGVWTTPIDGVYIRMYCQPSSNNGYWQNTQFNYPTMSTYQSSALWKTVDKFLQEVLRPLDREFGYDSHPIRKTMRAITNEIHIRQNGQYTFVEEVDAPVVVTPVKKTTETRTINNVAITGSVESFNLLTDVTHTYMFEINNKSVCGSILSIHQLLFSPASTNMISVIINGTVVAGPVTEIYSHIFC